MRSPEKTAETPYDAKQGSRCTRLHRPSCFLLTCGAVLFLGGCQDREEPFVENPSAEVAGVWQISQTQPAKATDKSGNVSFEVSLIEQTDNAGNPADAVVNVSIKQGSYVYGAVSPSTPFTPLAIHGTVQQPTISVGETSLSITTETEAGIPVYRDSFSAHIPMHLTSPEDGTLTLTIKIKFQACNDLACFPPDEVVMQLPLLVKRSTSL